MALHKLGILVGALLVCAASQGAAVEPWRDWNEMSATSKYYNAGAHLPWRNAPGDWRDADGVPQGPKAFAEVEIADTDIERWESWDITTMVQGWLSGRLPNNGLVLKSNSRRQANFLSIQSDDKSLHPHLVVRTADGQEYRLPATDDTYLRGSTVKVLGRQPELKIGFGLLKFDLSGLPSGAEVTEANMRLYTYAQYRRSVIGVYQLDIGGQEPPPPQAPATGLAEKYPGDRGIENDPAVVHFTDFERFDWASPWSIEQKLRTFSPVESAPGLKFEPLLGKALQAKVPKGRGMGLNLHYKFAEQLGYEPEEIYFRYYLRFADDWNPVQGGKLPGIAGTYGRAGWGGRTANGENGWAMRGYYSRMPDKSNPMHGLTPIGTYAAYADMPGKWALPWLWTRNGIGSLERNRWYCIEQHVKMNTPGKHDGIVRGWIDGKPAYENHEVMFRTVDALKIDRVWMNVYHGGTKPAAADHHVFVDNIVIAEEYIGPISGHPVESQ